MNSGQQADENIDGRCLIAVSGYPHVSTRWRSQYLVFSRNETLMWQPVVRTTVSVELLKHFYERESVTIINIRFPDTLTGALNL